MVRIESDDLQTSLRWSNAKNRNCNNSAGIISNRVFSCSFFFIRLSYDSVCEQNIAKTSSERYTSLHIFIFFFFFFFVHLSLYYLYTIARMIHTRAKNCFEQKTEKKNLYSCVHEMRSRSVQSLLSIQCFECFRYYTIAATRPLRWYWFLCICYKFVSAYDWKQNIRKFALAAERTEWNERRNKARNNHV